MKSVGDVIKAAREKKKLTLGVLSDVTSIREEYLRAIEQNRFDVLPSEVSARGFIVLISEALELHASPLLALYRRDVTSQVADAPALSRRFFILTGRRTSRLLLSTLLAGLVCSLAVYAAIVILRLSQAPPLDIRTPRQGDQVQREFLISGRTVTDAVVSIDGESVGVTQDGDFTSEQRLEPGPHVVTIKAVGRNGKERIVQVRIDVVESE